MLTSPLRIPTGLLAVQIQQSCATAADAIAAAAIAAAAVELMACIAVQTPLEATLTEEESRRNSRRLDLMYVSSSNPVTPDIFHLADQNRDLDAQARAQAAQPLDAAITGLLLHCSLSCTTKAQLLRPSSLQCCRWLEYHLSIVMCLMSGLAKAGCHLGQQAKHSCSVAVSCTST